jgi:hypothetical protein
MADHPGPGRNATGPGTFVIERTVLFVTTLTGDPTTASGGEGTTYVEQPRQAARLILTTTGK